MIKREITNKLIRSLLERLLPSVIGGWELNKFTLTSSHFIMTPSLIPPDLHFLAFIPFSPLDPAAFPSPFFFFEGGGLVVVFTIS